MIIDIKVPRKITEMAVIAAESLGSVDSVDASMSDAYIWVTGVERMPLGEIEAMLRSEMDGYRGAMAIREGKEL